MAYLDDPRVYYAAERTLLAWQRSALAFIVMGFVIEKFGLFVRYLHLSNDLNPLHSSISVAIGVLFMVLGTAISILSITQHKRFVASLSSAEIPPGQFLFLGAMISYLLALGGCLMVLWVVIGFVI